MALLVLLDAGPAGAAYRAVTPPAAHDASQAAVPAAPPGWTISSRHIDSGGLDRYYLVARPEVVTRAGIPVLLVLAGRGMTPAEMEQISGFLSIVGQAVLVFPSGYGESWNAGYCCGTAHTAGIDDVTFLEDVLRSVLTSQPATSARRVYLVGFSNGGRMALRMACSDPSAFAGVAAVEAVSVYTCGRRSPVSVLEIASTGDPLLTIPAGAPPKTIDGHLEITVDDLVTAWRSHNQCGQRVYSSGYGSTITVSGWIDCLDRAQVALAVYRGGEHSWPAGQPGVTPSASELVWSFFQRSLIPLPARKR